MALCRRLTARFFRFEFSHLISSISLVLRGHSVAPICFFCFHRSDHLSRTKKKGITGLRCLRSGTRIFQHIEQLSAELVLSEAVGAARRIFSRCVLLDRLFATWRRRIFGRGPLGTGDDLAGLVFCNASVSKSGSWLGWPKGGVGNPDFLCLRCIMSRALAVFCRSEALARLICCLLGSFVVFCVLCASLFLTNIPTPPHSSSAGLFPLAFLPCLKLSWDVFSYACTAIATNMVLAAGLAMHFSPWLGGFGGRERHGASLGWDRRVVECVLYMFLTSTNPFWVVRNDNKK